MLLLAGSPDSDTRFCRKWALFRSAALLCSFTGLELFFRLRVFPEIFFVPESSDRLFSCESILFNDFVSIEPLFIGLFYLVFPSWDKSFSRSDCFNNGSNSSNFVDYERLYNLFISSCVGFKLV